MDTEKAAEGVESITNSKVTSDIAFLGISQSPSNRTMGLLMNNI
jgi:hypothetical protein